MSSLKEFGTLIKSLGEYSCPVLSLDEAGPQNKKGNRMKKIKVLSTGYYDMLNNKVALLKEGEELNVVGETGPVKLVDYKVNCWQCLKDGRYVFVEKENAERIEVALS